MLFRNRPLVRRVACFLLLETLTTVVAPGVSRAMMGPGQPEFTSYEASGSPDLVNLTTGDFTYNIPLIEVPGPERSFSMPLTYRAGIKLEQEASWVGLGWSLNAGAIARSLTGYPDDAAGEQMQSTYQQKITRGWTGGVPGVLELGWDVNTGHSGSASLIGLVGLGWSGGGISSGSLVGVHVSKEGVTAKATDLIAAGATIATLGIGAPLSAVAMSAASQLGSDVVSGTAASVLLGKATSGGGALGEPSVKEEKGFLHTNYWVFYNDQKSESMYGSLNFGLMSQRTKPMTADNPSPYVYPGSTSSAGAKSPEFGAYANSIGDGYFYNSPGADLYLYNADGATYWDNNKNPVSIAHDDFSVMGGNVSGNIRPYRLEVGSLAFPYQGVNEHHKFATIPYLTDYQVPFRYENSVANSYDYHQFTPSAATTTDGMGIEGYRQPTYTDAWTGGIVLKDPSLYGTGTRTAPARQGIINQANARRLVQGKNIKWFSNEQIVQQYANSTNGDGSLLEVTHPTGQNIDNPPIITGYTNCDPTDPYCQSEPIYGPSTPTWSNNPWRVTLPGKGIGAFAITAEDGTTYHYSLPVYHYTQYSTSRQLVKDPGAEAPGVSTQTIGPRSWNAAGGGYATTWLLTAITSSDYVDRGQLGTVDHNDWGGWVRFDYGKFSTAYKWRQPYVGESTGENSFNEASHTEGYKETYYLNAIRTRSHTALFVKSVRNDARGHYQTEPSKLGIDETKPASSLRLDEVVLLANEDVDKLQTENGIGTGIPALSPNTASNNSQFDAAELRAGDTYQYVLDAHDLTADTHIRDFVNQHALKRVLFNYSYRLCANTPNSFAAAGAAPTFDPAQFACTRTGKLTLESISTYGPANTKLTPDFRFKYDFNPDYQQDSWDGFGMYKSGVTVNSSQGAPKDYHQVSTDFAIASHDASAWSLTEITSPLGGLTRLSYERDQYSKVSEYNLGAYSLSNTDCSNSFTATGLPAGKTLADFVKGGTVVQGTSMFNYLYACQSYGNCDQTGTEWCADDRACNAVRDTPSPIHILSVSGNTLTIDPSDVLAASCAPPTTTDTYRCGNLQAVGASLNIPSLAVTKNGGELRVATLSTLDEGGHSYQVRYRYTTDIAPAAGSSGVISKEPTFVTREARPFDGWFDYPGTGVLYGKTNVLRGLFRTDGDYSQREEYTFQTPSSSMVEMQHGYSWTQIALGNHNNDQYSQGWRQLDKNTTSTTVNLGAIGQPLGIKKFNQRGEVESSTSFGYSHTLPNPEGIAKQGYFTEGVMTNELLGNDDKGLYYYRINRSTKVYQPTVLVSSTTTTNGISSQSQQEKFDFYTGQVVASSFRNFVGDLYRSKVIPAYTLAPYAGMGPSSANGANLNMLTQQAGSYLYKVRADGSQAVVEANVQTWNSNWTAYRGYNSGTGVYSDQANDPQPIWRLCQSYLWVSPSLNADGTYADANFVDFNWKKPAVTHEATGWVKAGEFTRYDHYSKPLESQDINGQYVMRKLGYNQTQRLVTAANARYTEVAYSGAEDQADQTNGTLHFSGEVRDGDKRSTSQQHTGLYSTKLLGTQTGFTYQATIGSEVRSGRAYRLSCWVHKDANASQAQLYAQVDGNDLATTTSTASATKLAGNWYRLNLLFTVPPSGQRLTVGCRHTGSSGAAAVYIDDFRFNPVDGPSTAYVYDAASAQLTYVLDNDNLFTHYEYDAAGKVTRISKEVLTPTGGSQVAERKVKEYTYNFAQMPTPNWLPTGVVTWGAGPVGVNRPRQHEERDINSSSATFNTTRMVADGSSKSCVGDCPPNGTILATGLCGSREENGSGTTYYTYNLVADGRCSSYDDIQETSTTPFCNP